MSKWIIMRIMIWLMNPICSKLTLSLLTWINFENREQIVSTKVKWCECSVNISQHLNNNVLAFQWQNLNVTYFQRLVPKALKFENTCTHELTIFGKKSNKMHILSINNEHQIKKSIKCNVSLVQNWTFRSILYLCEYCRP
jgi:hypothetical protein